MNPSTPQEAGSKTQAQVQAIRHSLNNLEAALQHMAERMSPVLSPDYPKVETEGAGQAIEPPCSEHVGDLKRFTTRIDDMRIYVNSVMGRLDI